MCEFLKFKHKNKHIYIYIYIYIIDEKLCHIKII